MILKCVKEIELKTGVMTYPYLVSGKNASMIPPFVLVFAEDELEAKRIASFLYFRDFDFYKVADNFSVCRLIVFDQNVNEIKGVARVDKKDSDLAQGQCF